MAFYRLSIKLVETPVNVFTKLSNPAMVMMFDGPAEEPEAEDWTQNLYPDEIRDRLREGIARYAASESTVKH